MILKDKVALITGGSRGIGRAVALKLSSLGAKIAINYSSSDKDAEELVKLIEDSNGIAEAYKWDVSNYEETSKWIDTIMDRWNRIDILVNNAGITRDNLLIRMKENDWDKVIDINLKGVFNTSKAVSKIMMKQREGRIINISSVIGISGNAGQTNYAASKAGIIGFSKSLAKELASRNILVNVIAPGFIDTDMTDRLPEKFKGDILKNIPLGRYGKPEDIASLVTFLSLEDSSYITGQVINVDGGMLI